MSSEHPIGEPEELAALYLAGAMTLDEVARFEEHLAAGCERCAAETCALDQTAAALLCTVDEVLPNPLLRQQLLSQVDEPDETNPQVWKRWQAGPAPGALFIRRADEGEWQETGVAGVRVRDLFVDRAADQVTMLVRMAPGSSYPSHVHGGPEECLVLEGDLRVGADVLHAGDYQRAAPGSQHPAQSTERGCLLLIVSSLSDELN